MKFQVLNVVVACCLQSALAATDSSGSAILTCFWGGNSGKKVKLSTGLIKLDEYLETNVKSEEVGENLDKASAYLESNRPELDASLAAALELFSTLKKDGFCTENGLKIILQINKELGNPMAYATGIGPSHSSERRRSEKIILQIYEKIKLDCKNIFGQLVKSSYEQMDQMKLKRVKIFVDHSYKNLLPSNKDILKYPEHVLLGDYGIEDKKAKLLFDGMIKIAKDDEGGQYLIKMLDQETERLRRSLGMKEKSLFKHFFLEYLVRPCESYNKKIQRIFFQPIVDQHIGLDIKNDSQDKEYYLAYVRYKTCERLLKEVNVGLYSPIIKKVMHAAQ